MNLIKIFYPVKRMKRQVLVWENILTNCISDLKKKTQNWLPKYLFVVPNKQNKTKKPLKLNNKEKSQFKNGQNI